MSRAATEKSDHHHGAPKPIVRKLRRPLFLIWLVPILAAGLVGYYVYDHLIERGKEITITFASADGLKIGQTQVRRLGVQIGVVTDVQITRDQKQVAVKVRLQRAQDAFAKKGAQFWIVRPEISTESISGLGTVLSGPYIDSNPGAGDVQTQFIGLKRTPVSLPDGLQITLKAPNVERMQSETPVYYRGVQVGVIQDVELSSDSTGVNVYAVIRHRYAPLVKSNSQFWVISGIDVKGGLFSGVQMKMESLRTLISGGVGFATPEENMGEQAQNGSEFVLHDSAKKDWLEWAPKISISPDQSDQPSSGVALPNAPQAIRSSVD
jgi:paraquat-inducible protein B